MKLCDRYTTAGVVTTLAVKGQWLPTGAYWRAKFSLAFGVSRIPYEFYVALELPYAASYWVWGEWSSKTAAFWGVKHRSQQLHFRRSAASPRGRRTQSGSRHGQRPARCRDPLRGAGGPLAAIAPGRHCDPRSRHPQPDTAARHSRSSAVPVTRRRPRPAGQRGLSGALCTESLGRRPGGSDAGPRRGLPAHRPPTLAQRRTAYLHRTTTWMFLPFSSFLAPPPWELKEAMARRGRGRGRDRGAAARPELGAGARAAASAALNRAPPGAANQRRPRGTTGRHFKSGAARGGRGGAAPSRPVPSREGGAVERAGLPALPVPLSLCPPGPAVRLVRAATTARGQQDNVWPLLRTPLTPAGLRAAKLLACRQSSTIKPSAHPFFCPP